jgi:hypothetical protein
LREGGRGTGELGHLEDLKDLEDLEGAPPPREPKVTAGLHSEKLNPNPLTP